MKKIISILTVIAIIAVSVLTVVGSAVAVSAESAGVAWVHKFNSVSKVADYVTANFADVAYDDDLNAMKVNAKTDDSANSTEFTLNSSVANVSIADYKYLAICVKLPSVDYASSVTDADGKTTYTGSNVRLRPTVANNPSWGKNVYAATTDWQTVYFDISLFTYGEGVSAYSKIAVTLADWTGKAVKSADDFYVAWVGGFASIDAVNQYSESTVIKEDNGAAWVYDFNAQSKIDGHVTTTNNATVAYDNELNAMKINANADDVVNSTWWSMYSLVSNISVEEYPYLAMRVKLSSADLASCTVRQRPTTANNPTWGKTTYAATTDWQTVYFDISLFTYGENANTYSKIEVTMADWMGATVKAADTFYVAWIGGFKSIEDITVYSSGVEKFAGGRVYNFDNANKATTATVSNNKATTNKVDGVQTYVYDSVDAYSYDVANNALYIQPKVSTGDHNVIVNVTDLGISAEDYPIVAYKAKWSDEAMNTFATAGKTAVASHITAATASSSATSNPGSGHAYGPEHGGTGLSGVKSDWQIAYADFTANQMTDNYTNITLDVIGYRTYQTQGIPETLPIYIEWIGFFSSIKEAYAYDTECAISEISYEITSADAEEIAAVNAKYNALEDAVKPYVCNIDVLEDVNAIYNVVSSIADAVNTYTGPITYEDYLAIKDIESAYRALSFERRARVSNYSALGELQKVSGIVYTITLIPELITYKASSVMNSIEASYAALTDAQKAQISNIELYNAAKVVYDEICAADLGDLDCDKSVDIRDLVRLKKECVEIEQLMITNPDLNGDEVIDGNDLVILREILLGA